MSSQQGGQLVRPSIRPFVRPSVRPSGGFDPSLEYSLDLRRRSSAEWLGRRAATIAAVSRAGPAVTAAAVSREVDRGLKFVSRLTSRAAKPIGSNEPRTKASAHPTSNASL